MYQPSWRILRSIRARIDMSWRSEATPRTHVCFPACFVFIYCFLRLPLALDGRMRLAMCMAFDPAEAGGSPLPAPLPPFPLASALLPGMAAAGRSVGLEIFVQSIIAGDRCWSWMPMPEEGMACTTGREFSPLYIRLSDPTSALFGRRGVELAPASTGRINADPDPGVAVTGGGEEAPLPGLTI